MRWHRVQVGRVIGNIEMTLNVSSDALQARERERIGEVDLNSKLMFAMPTEAVIFYIVFAFELSLQTHKVLCARFSQPLVVGQLKLLTYF